MIPFGLESLMTVTLPMARRVNKCLIPGASAIYLCDEGTGATLYDRSGNGNHGTLGAGEYAPAWVPQGLSFATNDSVDLGILPALATGAPYTIQAVVMFDDVTTNDGYFFCQNTSTATTGGAGCYLFKSKTKGKIYFVQYAADGTQKERSTAAAIEAGRWYVVTGVWDGTSMRLWVNETATAPLTTTFAPAVATAAKLGRRANTTAGFLFGDIAAADAYPFALSDEQIQYTVSTFGAMLAPRGIDINL